MWDVLVLEGPLFARGGQSEWRRGMFVCIELSVHVQEHQEMGLSLEHATAESKLLAQESGYDTISRPSVGCPDASLCAHHYESLNCARAYRQCPLIVARNCKKFAVPYCIALTSQSLS